MLTEAAKISHIHSGGVPEDYSQSDWEALCIKKRLSGSQ